MFKYGMKEVADVVFYNIATGKPELFFDTLKVSTIENESESDEARGGQGNPRRISWDYGRTATLNMQDALLSDISLASLAGTQVETEDITAHGRDVVTVKEGAIELEVTPTSAVQGNIYKGGIMLEPVTIGEDLSVTGAENGDEIIVFYEYKVATGASKVTFTGRDFPSTYKVVGSTLGRGEDGLDREMQFVIPRAKLQSAFSLTMDVENVSTFDFNLDVMVDSGQKAELYHVIHLPHETD